MNGVKERRAESNGAIRALAPISVGIYAASALGSRGKGFTRASCERRSGLKAARRLVGPQSTVHSPQFGSGRAGARRSGGGTPNVEGGSTVHGPQSAVETSGCL